MLTGSDLDSWATSAAVVGHAHSRPSTEPYELSATREVSGGSGAEQMPMPDGWSSRMVSAAGLKSSECPNQDAFSYTLLESGWILCIACDGHGEEGDIIAERVARTLPYYLSAQLSSLGPEKALMQAFQASQDDLETCLKAAQTYSGTTASVVCVHAERSEVWFAFAGDSKVALGDLASGATIFVTGEHKAHDPYEADRLRECGAQVICKDYADGDLVSRVFVPGTGVPGLAMSRSLGDGCLKGFGVVATPDVFDVTERWSSCEAPIAVLASDGLWDTIGAQETITTLSCRVHAGLDVKRGAEVLLRRSQKLWIQAEGDYCDDVTVMLVGPSSSFSSRKGQPAKAAPTAPAPPP